MSNVIISIGGTGSRISESFTYLLSAGLISNSKLFKFYIVDKDKENGNTNRFTSTVTTYKQNIHALMEKTDEAKFGKNNVERGTIDFDQIMKSMEHAGMDTLKSVLKLYPNTVNSNVVNCLFSQEELDQQLSEGFYGHASLGATFFKAMASSRKYEENDLFKIIKNELATSTEEINIVIVGSIFGGTGASIFPNIAQSIRDKFCRDSNGYNLALVQRIRISGVLMLPYFKFPASNDAAHSIDVNANDFMEKTVSALKAYQENPRIVKKTATQNDYIFDSMYLMGCQPDETCSVHARGSQDQLHRFHFVDLMGGLAMCHFFNSFDKNDVDQIFVASLSTSDIDKITWDNIPDAVVTKKKIMAMAFFSAYILAYLKPYMEKNVESIKKDAFLIRLYGNTPGVKYKLFPEANINNVQREEMLTTLNDISKYCKPYLQYLHQIQQSNVGGNQKDCKLFNETSIMSVLNENMTDAQKNNFALESIAATGTYITETKFKDITSKLMNDVRTNKMFANGQANIATFIEIIYECCLEKA